jgi:hypothetical protein
VIRIKFIQYWLDDLEVLFIFDVKFWHFNLYCQNDLIGINDYLNANLNAEFIINAIRDLATFLKCVKVIANAIIEKQVGLVE